jgi:hypothetical protein
MIRVGLAIIHGDVRRWLETSGVGGARVDAHPKH